jgi:hypothetical protein
VERTSTSARGLTGTLTKGAFTARLIGRSSRTAPPVFQLLRLTNGSMIDHGVAGRSARRTYDRRVAKRYHDVRTGHPWIGPLLLMYGEPQTTRAWLIGAVGEEIVGGQLDVLSSRGVIALHDRRIPQSRANIDHIAIGPSGVFVIDAKHYAGQRVRKDFVGSVFRPGPPQLFVDKKNCTDLVAEIARPLDAVMTALGSRSETREVPVVPMLAFIRAAASSLRGPIDVAGVWVGRPNAMADVVSGPGPLSTDFVLEIAALLAMKMKPR